MPMKPTYCPSRMRRVVPGCPWPRPKNRDKTIMSSMLVAMNSPNAYAAVASISCYKPERSRVEHTLELHRVHPGRLRVWAPKVHSTLVIDAHQRSRSGFGGLQVQ